jgi:tRNA(adenine34) deaminase
MTGDHIDIEEAMRLALETAQQAASHGEVPVGAVVLDPSGTVTGRGHNRRIADRDPTAHAEIVALREAATAAGTWRLDGHTLVVTLEPCPMCAGAAVNARIARLAYGAADPAAGAAWSLYNIPQDPRLNHGIELQAGIMDEEASSILERFFAERRPGSQADGAD